MSGIHIATNESTAYAPPELFAGDTDLVTNAYLVATGLTLPANSVVAFNPSGELVEWVPGAVDSTAVAVGITCEAIDTTSGATEQPIYVAGYFNTDAIQWPAGTTDAQKRDAFLGTNITHRKLA